MGSAPPDIVTFDSVAAWVSAWELGPRDLARRLGGRHWTGWSRILSGTEPLTPAVAREVAARLGLDEDRAKVLELLPLAEHLRPGGLQRWAVALTPSRPEARAAQARLTEGRSRGWEQDVSLLVEDEGVSAGEAAEGARRLAEEQTFDALAAARARAVGGDRLAAGYARPARVVRGDDPVAVDSLADLDAVRGAIVALSDNADLGRRSLFLTVHQAADAGFAARAEEVMRGVERELVGREVAGGAPFRLHLGVVGESRSLPGVAAAAPPTHESGDFWLAEHADQHHGALLARCWGTLHAAAVRWAMERQYPLGRRDGSVGLVTAYVLDLDPTSPAVVKARPRFQRLRSPRADRVECLRPEEVARVAEGIEADPGLLAQMVARDRSRSPALEEAITRRAADLKARSIAAERVLDAPLAPLALELGRLSADAGDPAWLASVAWPPPSHGAAVAAVEALATLRILRRGADGRLTSVARNGLRLARRHDTTPVDERLRAIHLGASDTIAASCAAPGEAPPFFLRSSRVRLNPEGIALARRRLVAALQALNSDAERTGPWDRVVQLHAFAFPEAPLG